MKSKLLFLTVLLLMSQSIRSFAVQINPVSYSMLNGQSGSFSYRDETYSGTGNPNANGSPLSGGLGQLTDGLDGGNAHNSNFGEGAAYRWVGWSSITPEITFDFGARFNFAHTRIHVDTGSASTDIGIFGRARISVSDDGVNFTALPDYVTPAEELSNTANRYLEVPINAAGRYVRVRLEDNPTAGKPWVFISEVVFEGAAVTVYSTDFESGIGAEWSSSTVDNSHPGTFTQFSGRYVNSAQTLTLADLTPGTSYTVRFDLYIIDSWDGVAHNDAIIVEANGSELFNYNFSNYNGDPPSQPQTYPGQPDSGRVSLGFNSYVDAIYRNIELQFTPAEATATLTWRGANLQWLDDESWGLDNVRVVRTADVVATIIDSTTLPDAGTTSTRAWDSFSITALRFLNTTSANNAANYSLRAAGPNGTFDDGDDIVYALTPSHNGGRIVNFTIAGSPLQPGQYRFRSTGLLDSGGAAVTDFARDFAVAHPVLGRIENTSNDTLEGATILPVEETPAGSGLFTAIGVGTFGAVNENDFWAFQAETGDRVTIRLDAETGGSTPRLNLQNGSGGNLATDNGNGSYAFLQSFVITGPGPHYIRV